MRDRSGIWKNRGYRAEHITMPLHKNGIGDRLVPKECMGQPPSIPELFNASTIALASRFMSGNLRNGFGPDLLDNSDDKAETASWSSAMEALRDHSES